MCQYTLICLVTSIPADGRLAVGRAFSCTEGLAHLSLSQTQRQPANFKRFGEFSNLLQVYTIHLTGCSLRVYKTEEKRIKLSIYAASSPWNNVMLLLIVVSFAILFMQNNTDIENLPAFSSVCLKDWFQYLAFMFLFDLTSFTWSNKTGTSSESSETKCRNEYKCTTFVIIWLWQKWLHLLLPCIFQTLTDFSWFLIYRLV